MEFFLLFACWMMIGLFELSEMALVSSNRRKLARKAEGGNRGAKKALELLANPTKFLSTVQVGLTFGSIIAATYGGQPLAMSFAPYLKSLTPTSWVATHAEEVSRALVSFLIGSLTIICAEIVPKRIGLSNPEAFAMVLSRPMAAISWLASPLVNTLSGTADIVLKIFGRRRTAEDTVSEDELRMMVDQGMASGVLHATEHRMVHGALAMDGITASQLMTPSNRVVWLNLDEPEEINWRKIVASGHTWFPVFRGSPDRPLGVVSVKRLWANLSLAGSAVIKDLLTEAPTVSPLTNGTQLLERFRKEKIHMALVVDEFGQVKGVVSLNDVLESVVGELPTEGSPGIQNKPTRRREDGSWIVDAIISLDDFRESTGIVGRFAGEGTGRFSTVSGFMMRALGRIPIEGDRVEAVGHIFEVMDMDGHRMDKVLVMPKAPTIKV